MEKRKIYMDYSATTPVKKEVLDAMMPYFTETFGNASSFHSFGRDAKNVLDKSRQTVANLINAKPNEIYFTAGGTESDNWAIEGVAFANKAKGNHIITSKIEHHGVLHVCEYLQKHHGFEVTYLDVDADGRVNAEDVEKAITDKTILISIMFANNEVGTIQPIKEIGEIAKKHNIIFHTDAVQAAGNIPIDVKELNIDLMSMSSHKIYGPKGIGALYVRRKPRVRLRAEQHGGGHERGMRSGTLATHQIVGMGEAFAIAAERLEQDHAHAQKMHDKLWAGIQDIEEIYLNGDANNSVPNIINISFNFVEGESLMMSLKAMAVSSGSACTSATLEPSYVLRAIGRPDELAHSSIRFSFGRYTTEEDIDTVITQMHAAVDKLRALSPLWDMYQEGVDLDSVEWAEH